MYQRRDTLNHLIDAEKAAVDQNARPMVLLQDLTPKPADTSLMADASSSRLLTQITSMQQSLAQITCAVSNNQRTLQNPQTEEDFSVVGGIRQAMLQSPLFSEALQPSRNPTRYLPQGYSVARGPEAREPSNLMDMITNFEEMVGALLGVPRSFWAQFSGQKSSNSPDARLMYRSGQRFVKQRLAPLCTSIARWIHSEHLAEAVASESQVSLSSSLWGLSVLKPRCHRFLRWRSW